MGPKLRHAFQKRRRTHLRQYQVPLLQQLSRRSIVYSRHSGTLVGTWSRLKWWVMSLFQPDGKNSCFTEDALLMSRQSSGQDLSLEEEKVKMDDRPSSSHFWNRSKTQPSRRRTQQRLLEAKRSTVSHKMEASSRLRHLGELGQSTRKGIAVLADKVSRQIVHNSAPACCIEKWYVRKEIEFYMKDVTTIVPKNAWKLQQE